MYYLFWNTRFSDKALAGNDNALSANLSLAEKTSVEIYHVPTCPVVKKTTSIFLSAYVVFLLYSSTLMLSGIDILAKDIQETTRKHQSFAGNNKALSEMTKYFYVLRCLNTR